MRELRSTLTIIDLNQSSAICAIDDLHSEIRDLQSQLKESEERLAKAEELNRVYESALDQAETILKLVASPWATNAHQLAKEYLAAKTQMKE